MPSDPFSARKDVTVYYEHNTDPEVFSFGDCVPWTHDESPAETVVFGKEATCSLYTYVVLGSVGVCPAVLTLTWDSDEQCEAPSNEDDVHVWPGQKYWYPGSSYPLKGGSARCDVPQ
jgi:hypothetical protein